MVTTVLAFLLALGVLVTFHEFGHYWVARRMGVKVLRFSIGFGPAIVKWQRGETEWAIAPVPLGGYVRMLDSREGEVAPTEMHRAFDQQTVWRRVVIVAAGPVANLLLAVVLVWVTLLNGTEGLRPGVGSVVPGSPAAVAGLRAGQEVESINGQPVHDWQELRLALVEALTDMMALGGGVPASMESVMAQSLEQIQTAPAPSVLATVWGGIWVSLLFGAVFGLIIAGVLSRAPRPFDTQAGE